MSGSKKLCIRERVIRAILCPSIEPLLETRQPSEYKETSVEELLMLEHLSDRPRRVATCGRRGHVGLVMNSGAIGVTGLVDVGSRFRHGLSQRAVSVISLLA